MRAVAIGKRHNRLKGATLAQYRADLDRRLSGPKSFADEPKRNHLLT